MVLRRKRCEPAVEESGSRIRMLIFERRTHNRSVNRTELYFLQQTRPDVFSRGKKRHGESLIWQPEIAHFSPGNLKNVNDYAVAETDRLCKRKPKMIPKTPEHDCVGTDDPH